MKKINIYYTLLLMIVLSIWSCKQTNKEIEDPNDFTFVFITDIHIEPGLNAPAGFKQAIDSINKINPGFVLTGGDLIADALGQNYERADSLYNLYNQMIKEIKAPVYNTIGNHEVFGIYKESGVNSDHPEYGKKMYENKLGKRYYTFRHNGWIFMVLDNIAIDGNRYYGLVDSIEMQWIKSTLDTIDPSTPIIIDAHIPFISSYMQITQGPMAANSEGLVLNNSKEVLELFKGHNLKAVLQGHLHFYEDIFVNNIHFVTGGAISSKWWKGKNHGTEEGFVIARVKNNQISFEYKDYGWVVDEARAAEN